MRSGTVCVEKTVRFPVWQKSGKILFFVRIYDMLYLRRQRRHQALCPQTQNGLRHPASASCLERHSRLAGRGPNLASLFPP